jgi:hypothetical protein
MNAVSWPRIEAGIELGGQPVPANPDDNPRRHGSSRLNSQLRPVYFTALRSNAWTIYRIGTDLFLSGHPKTLRCLSLHSLLPGARLCPAPLEADLSKRAGRRPRTTIILSNFSAVQPTRLFAPFPFQRQDCTPAILPRHPHPATLSVAPKLGYSSSRHHRLIPSLSSPVSLSILRYSSPGTAPNAQRGANHHSVQIFNCPIK